MSLKTTPSVRNFVDFVSRRCSVSPPIGTLNHWPLSFLDVKPGRERIVVLSRVELDLENILTLDWRATDSSRLCQETDNLSIVTNRLGNFWRKQLSLSISPAGEFAPYVPPRCSYRGNNCLWNTVLASSPLPLNAGRRGSKGDWVAGGKKRGR